MPPVCQVESAAVGAEGVEPCRYRLDEFATTDDRFEPRAVRERLAEPEPIGYHLHCAT
jgi:hypothetical protein